MGLLDFVFRQAPGALAGIKRGQRVGREEKRQQTFEDLDRAAKSADTARMLEEYGLRSQLLKKQLNAPPPPKKFERVDLGDGRFGNYDPETGGMTPIEGITKAPPKQKFALKTASGGRVTPVNEETGMDPEGNPVYERVPAGPQAPQTDTFGNALKLRGEFQDLTKNARTIAESYQKVQQAANDPSAAGDLSLIFGYMRLLDPGSTVREGEFANAQNSGSIPQRIQAQYNKALAGERLTQSQRDDFLNQAGGVVQSQRQIIQRYQDQYKGVAGKYKIDPGMVIDDPFQGIAEPRALGGSDPQRAEAEKAIAAGADPAKVRARYTQLTGKPWP